MAKDFMKIRNGAFFTPQPSPPSSPNNGDIYFDSGLGKFQKREAGIWQDLGGSPVLTAAHNFLDNSNFFIWQRGTSQTGVNGGNWGADRWFYSTEGNTAFIGQVSGVANTAAFGLGFQVTTATAPTNPLLVAQTLENADSVLLYNQTASFGARFLARGNVTQLSIQFSYATSEGGAPAVSSFIGSPVLVNVNTSTYTMGSILAQALGTAQTKSGVIGIVIQTAAVSSGNLSDVGNGFNFEQPMLNLGNSLAPFAPKMATQEAEYAQCLRFLWRAVGTTIGTGYFDSTTATNYHVPFPVPMRAVPFLSISASSDLLITRAGSSNTNATGTTNYTNTTIYGTDVKPTSTSNSVTGYGSLLGVVGSGFFQASAEI